MRGTARAVMSPSTTLNTRQPINYVFVDYENVPDVDLSFVGDKTVHLTLLIGSRQTKTSLDQVEHLMKHAATTVLVRLESSGKNSLDFSLAYYLGRAVQSDPTAHFHIISKDTGFRPLIEHLKARHISVKRHDDGSTLTFAASEKPAPANSVPEDLTAKVLEGLRQQEKNRPKNRTRLSNYVKSHLGTSSEPSKIESIIQQLEKDRHLSFGEKGVVTYHFKCDDKNLEKHEPDVVTVV